MSASDQLIRLATCSAASKDSRLDFTSALREARLAGARRAAWEVLRLVGEEVHVANGAFLLLRGAHGQGEPAIRVLMLCGSPLKHGPPDEYTCEWLLDASGCPHTAPAALLGTRSLVAATKDRLLAELEALAPGLACRWLQPRVALPWQRQQRTDGGGGRSMSWPWREHQVGGGRPARAEVLYVSW